MSRLLNDTVSMSVILRSGLLAFVLTIPVASRAQETQTFSAADASYSFEYPQGFTLDHMFADGTGDVTGVTASNMSNGDVVITFLGPRDSGDMANVSEQNHQAIVDEFTKAIAVLPSIKLTSSAMTTMLGQPAIDMVFANARFKNVAINRYVFTVVDGQAYNFECIYGEDKAEQFAPACDLAVSSVRLLDAGTSPADGEEARAAPVAGSCTELELNRRTGEVMALASSMLMKDQSPAMIARVKTAHDAAAAVDVRAGANPSEQDCKDVDAIVETLK